MATMSNTSKESNTTQPADEAKAKQPPTSAGVPIRRVLRGLARTLAVIIVLVVGLAAVGATYEAIASGGDAAAYPPPGKLVDVGGYRLHIDCVGTASAGNPTVILDAGLSRTSLDWSLVQPEVGKSTQVCAYDRAGMGWSDPAPQDKPRTPGQIATELHTLLTNAGIAGPYVLVGHSLAGKNIRMFTLQHPDEVAGMVLVDARGEYVDEHSTPADEQAFRDGMRGQGNTYRLVRTLGLARLIGAGQEGSPAMSGKTRMEMVLFTTRQQDIDTTFAEGIQRAADDSQLHTSSLGERPLMVLAAGQNMEHLPYWPESQQLMSNLSTNGYLTVVEGSGHSIHVEQPAVVIDAIQQVLAQTRSH